MKDSRTFGRVKSAAYRVLLAVAFLLVTSLQPGMMAMAKSAWGSARIDLVQQNETHDHGGVNAQQAKHETTSDKSDNHHGGATNADLCCEMHCMPATTMPPCSSDLAPRPSGALGLLVVGALTPGKDPEFIKPPRT